MATPANLVEIPDSTVLESVSVIQPEDPIEEQAQEQEEQEQEQEQEQEAAMEDQQQMTPDMAMSGAAIQSMAGPQAMPAVQGPTQGQENLTSLLSNLRRPQTASGGV